MDLPKCMPIFWLAAQPKKHYTWFCQHLLKQDERIDEGGLGVQELLKISLDDILDRWQFVIIEKALVKI
jgi:hypothetical protein